MAEDTRMELDDDMYDEDEDIAQVNSGLGQIDQVTQQNTASAEEGAAAAEELTSQAVHLKGLMSSFKVKGGTQMVSAAQPALPRQEMPSGKNGWGDTAEKRHQKPSEVITLDDNEFGKF